MPDAWRPRPAVLALALGMGVILRLWFLRHHLAVDGDSLLYGDIAKNVLRSHVYGFTQDGAAPLPTLIRLPGYPLFLAACFRVFGVEHYDAVMGVQCVLDLLACWLLSSLAGRTFRSRRASEGALWLGAMCPLTANYVAAPLTETLTLAGIVAALYGLGQWWWAGGGWNRWLSAIGLSLGASLLLRPEQALFAAAVLGCMGWSVLQRGRSAGALLPVLVCGLGALLPLLPWTMRNAITFHVFQPLAPRSAVDPGEPVPRGFNRWFRTWGVDFGSTEDVYWNYDGNTIDWDDLPARVADGSEQRERTRQLIADYNRTAKPSPEIEARFAALAEERVRASPLRFYAGLPLARLGNMLLRPRTELLAVPLDWWAYGRHPGWTVLAWGLGTVNLLYLGLGIAGAARWWGLRQPGARLLLLACVWFVGLRCALLLTLDNSEPRYTLEFFPVWVLGMAGLLVWVGKRESWSRGAVMARRAKAVATADSLRE